MRGHWPRATLLVLLAVAAFWAGHGYHGEGDLLWATTSLALVGLSTLLGFVLGELAQVPDRWSGAALVVLNAAAWCGVATGGAATRGIGWMVASGTAGALAGVAAFWLGRTLPWPKVVACLALTGIVATAGAATGRYVGRVTASTPKGTDTAAGQDLRDCTGATVVATRDAKPTTWAALGDSYSAGVGGAVSGSPYGQDFSNAFAWVGAGLLRNPKTREGVNLKLSACSGAVVSDIFTRRVGSNLERLDADEIPDVPDAAYWYGLNDALRSLKSAAVVTLTIGGNDAGFGNVAKTMARDHGCGPGGECTLLSDDGLANLPTDGDDRKFSAITPEGEWDELSARLVNAYRVTLALMPPSARLLVVQYPLAFAKPGRSCGKLLAIGARNMGLINRFAAKLDATIAAAAAEAARASHRPVDVVPWGGERPGSLVAKFAGVDRDYSAHGLCSRQPWIHGFAGAVPGRTVDDSFHPSTAGVLAAACYTAREVFRVQPYYEAADFEVVRDRCPT